MGVTGPGTSSSQAGNYRARDYQQAMVCDCRERTESIRRALDFLKLRPSPDEDSAQWEALLNQMERDRIAVSLDLDRFAGSFAPRPDGERISVVLARIKRLEGGLANFCARFEVQLPLEP